MTETARSLALSTLIKVFKQGAYSNIVLEKKLAKSHLSQADRDLATRLVYGTLQSRLFLQYQIDQLQRSAFKENYLQPLLLMSAYQLLLLDRIPAHAVLNEANKLAKVFGKAHSGGYRLVNGILRHLKRHGPFLPPRDDWLTYWSIRESFPKWLVQYFLKLWGKKRTLNVLKSFNQIPENSVRVSNLYTVSKVKKELQVLGFDPQSSNLAERNLILSHGGVAQTKPFKEGKLTIQDEAASLVVAAFRLSGTEDVLDTCSAPGGKTVQIAEHLTTGHVTALDIHERKLKLVKKNAKRMRVADHLQIKAMDARQADQYFTKNSFDRILVDAPCSGLGLLRRKPEIRYTKTKKDILKLQKVELAILEHVSPLLRTRGELVYSTCSLTEEEDEEVIKRFLQMKPQFKLVPFKLAHVETATGMLKILPDEDGSDGFFIAKLILRG